MKKCAWYDPNKPEAADEYTPTDIEVGIEPLPPDDTCEKVDGRHGGFADHSDSRPLIEELYSCDWGREIQKEAMVDKKAARLLKDNPLGYPRDQWPEDADPSVAVVSRWYNGALA